VSNYDHSARSTDVSPSQHLSALLAQEPPLPPRVDVPLFPRTPLNPQQTLRTVRFASIFPHFGSPGSAFLWCHFTNTGRVCESGKYIAVNFPLFRHFQRPSCPFISIPTPTMPQLAESLPPQRWLVVVRAGLVLR
jgi:hypothetical protein